MANSTERGNGNFVFSPASVSYQLAVASTGPFCISPAVTETLDGGEDIAATHLELASHLPLEGEGYSTNLNGLLIHNADRTAVMLSESEEIVADFSIPVISVAGDDMNEIGHQWMVDVTKGRNSMLPETLNTATDLALLTHLEYSSTWSSAPGVTTMTFTFEEGRSEPVPALEIAGAKASEANRGTVIELPTTSPDPTRIFLPDDPSQPVTSDDWETIGLPRDAVVTVPTFSTTTAFDMGGTYDGKGMQGDACEMRDGVGLNTELVNPVASYELSSSGISIPPGEELELTDTTNPSEVPSLYDDEEVQHVQIDRPFTITTTDADTGWTLLYGTITDPTRRL
ncbi:serpin family protein [Flaviflexus massiliensis]|uniref:serpin family protein n=1 Tax=Flaviflexus massiliensis TaxID=1522309 RepID=UPI0036F30A1B